MVQQVVQRMTTSDYEWQWVTMNDNGDNEWQRVTKNDTELANYSEKRMKVSKGLILCFKMKRKASLVPE